MSLGTVPLALLYGNPRGYWSPERAVFRGSDAAASLKLAEKNRRRKKIRRPQATRSR